MCSAMRRVGLRYPPEVLNILIGVQVPNSTKHVDQGRGTGRRRMPLSSSYMALSLSERGIPSTVEIYVHNWTDGGVSLVFLVSQSYVFLLLWTI